LKRERSLFHYHVAIDQPASAGPFFNLLSWPAERQRQLFVAGVKSTVADTAGC
jgi:hypothetical protein